MSSIHDKRRFDGRRQESRTARRSSIKLGDTSIKLGDTSKFPRSVDFGAIVADEMFGADDELDLELDLDVEPEASSWESSVPAPVREAINLIGPYIKAYAPSVKRYSVNAGRSIDGQKYAEVVLEGQDPLNMLQQFSAYALQVTGAHGVSLTAPPAQVPGQVRLIFSYGAPPVLGSSDLD